jgi:hypothetical protein
VSFLKLLLLGVLLLHSVQLLLELPPCQLEEGKKPLMGLG